ncbi:type I polyketide synthase [Isoptericola sp. 178]|uniref:type I polyketide synthase n=1 Tax=Isoptericola sp. 178 TaxID=3064651 RepID=UPI00271225FD|nr:type I polyketide synthase [Isoptericola sp. 178]MDO8145912.1 SDR family NAD(P)-dependent oxidoreductase [Isoptericola sp. 178]
MTSERIAIVGVGLRYPDAATPDELWTNVLAGRRAFRTMPEERTSLADYWDPDPAAPDKFYASRAAVLRDYTFDRVAKMISARTVTSTDMTHWLALDVATDALRAAGFEDGEGLPLATTSVVLGNTLTGEFSRANVMRLRWPYVRRTISAQLAERGWENAEIDGFVRDLEGVYKAPFPEANEDMLAGGLANTIAGRICNFFDLGGGGYTVDGACSSSLLSVINAANALRSGDADVVLAGGVDLSIDPFELVGFSKTGALATGEMVVYDRGSNGFWPGEGCGMVVLMREDDARAQGRQVLACIAGWGMSSDGKGGITRPEESGHRRALAHAYARAGYHPSTVSYFEGHGTGTAVGDATEIAALASTREGIDDPWPAALGSVKANIGHTKAAAGVAGLIKAALSVHHQVVPPASGHVDPHPLLSETAHAIHVPTDAGVYRSGVPVRAGVSAMGFGGINTHIALESADAAPPTRASVAPEVTDTVLGRQDAELLLFAAADVESLAAEVREAAGTLERAATCELTDLAVHLQRTLTDGEHRVAVVARDPGDAVARLERVADLLTGTQVPTGRLVRVGEGIWFGRGAAPGRIAFAFPGQGAGHGHPGAPVRRFDAVHDRVGQVDDGPGTAGLQPRVVRRSLQGLAALTRLGVEADAAIGHSLGEITALAWSGALSEERAIELARVRGRAMYDEVPRTGAMAVVGAGPDRVRALLDGTAAEVSGYNAPELTVVAGPRTDVEAVVAASAIAGLDVSVLDVEHAFHTSQCARAAAVLRDHLRGVPFGPLQRDVVSPSSAALLPEDQDVSAFLVEQITNPVRFSDAAKLLGGHDLVIEVGPGRTIGGLVAANLPTVPTVSIDTDSRSLAPFLDAVGAAHVVGRSVSTEELVRGRAYRPLVPGQRMTFLANPCEAAPGLGFVPTETSEDEAAGSRDTGAAAGASTLEVLLSVVADKVDLPVSVLGPATSPLDDLHLSSITVGQITNDVLRSLGRGPLHGVPSFATSTLGDIATMIDEMSDRDEVPAKVIGAGPWVRAFGRSSRTEDLLPAPAQGPERRWTLVGADDELTDRVLARLARLPGVEPGVLVSTTGRGPDAGADAIEALLGALRQHGTVPLVVLQRGDHGAAAAARSLFLEGSSPRVTVVRLPAELADPLPAVADSIAADVDRTAGFAEVTYADGGARRHDAWAALETSEASSASYLGADDVLLVTGGGKGITAASALRIAEASGCRLLLLGRAPMSDPAVSATLDQARSAGVGCVYVAADVTDAAAVARAVREGAATLGTVTAVLHGAGTNEPARARDLTREQLDRTVAPKVHGLRNVLACLDASRLRLLVAFGSIIGRAGLEGEVHYATANDWLTEEVLAFGRENPQVRVRAVEWSVWSGAGMGERLGVLESLRQRGIEPIPSEWGVGLVTSLVDDGDLPPLIVVAGRTGTFPTMRHAPGDLPLLRFLETPQVHYAGVELVVDAELSPGTDPYLADHVLDGEMIFPGVMGMEAMAQAAVALRPQLRGGLAFADLSFDRPVLVPPDRPETIRVAALVEGDSVRVAVRTAGTAFAVDHFTALITPPPDVPEADAPASAGLEPVGLEPGRDLYGSLMFQGPRFQAVRGYRAALARRAVADLDTGPGQPWFSLVHPQELILAAPGARDAMMHAIQCCVPDAVLLPERVDLLVPAMATHPSAEVLMEAYEDVQDGDSYTYRLACHDLSGPVETWSGLRLRAVTRRPARTMRWSPAMTGPYLQRQAEELFGRGVEVAVEPHAPAGSASRADDRAATDRAIARLRPGATLRRQADGRLLLDDTTQACSAHHALFTMSAVAPRSVACDTEAVVERPDDVWQDLLGDAWTLVREIAAAAGGDVHEAATRVWGALECVRKVGHASIGLTLASTTDDAVVIAAGPYRVITWVLPTGETGTSTMFALLGGH